MTKGILEVTELVLLKQQIYYNMTKSLYLTVS